MSSSSSCDFLSMSARSASDDGVPDAGDDVLALRVLEVVAVHALGAAGGVAGEADAGAGVHAAVAEHHRLHVDRGAEVLGDLLLAAVQPGAVGVPGVEDRARGQVELLARVLREVPAGVLADQALERLDELLEVVRREVEVRLAAAALLQRVQLGGEELVVEAEHGAAEHLQQPPVGVLREPLVVALPRQPGDGLVVEPDVEDRLHHPGHRELGAGPDADQQRVVGVAELAAHLLLERLEVLGDLGGELVRLAALGEIGPAGLGGDREPVRDRQPEVGHLGQVGALATQQVLLVLVSLSEVEDEGAHARFKHCVTHCGATSSLTSFARWTSSAGFCRMPRAGSAHYRSAVADGPVVAPVDEDLLASRFGGPLPDGPSAPAAVVDRLVAAAEPGLVGTTGPRYFGFVIGGSSPASTAADMLTSGWDQNGFTGVLSPAARAAEAAAGAWVKELLGIPADGLLRLRHRHPGGQHDRAGRGPAPRPRRRRLGRRPRRAERRAAGPGRGERRAARDHRPVAAAARVRRRAPRARGHRRQRCDRRGALRRVLADGPDGPVIVCLQSGQREHRGLRRPARRVRRGARGGRRGRTWTARSGSGRRPAPPTGTSTTASSWPTRGAPTRTSG